MLLALIIVPVAIFSQPDKQVGFEKIDPAMLSFINDNTTVLGLVSLLAWGLGYFGQPHILSRFMAIGDPKDLVLSRRIAMSWMILSLIGALATGIAGSLYFAAEPLENAETVFINLAHIAFNPWIGGLLIAAILSAIMSTIDSQLLVCSSVITEDFYLKWLRPKASDKELMLVGRFGVIAIALVAGIVALNPASSVLGLVSYAWAGFGAAFGPVVILSLFWRGYSRNGAVLTILVGAVTVVIWKQLTGGIFDLYEIVPGFILATLVGVVVSKLSPPTPKTMTDFDNFNTSLKS